VSQTASGGDGYFEAVIGDVRVKYWNKDSHFATNHKVEIIIEGTNRKSAEKVFEIIKDLGVTHTRPTALDRELLYLTRIAYHMNGQTTGKVFDGMLSVTKGLRNTEKKVDAIKQYLAKEMGVDDITKTAGYNPEGIHQAFDHGRVHQYRPGLTGKAWDDFEEGYKLHHSSRSGHAAESIERLLEGGGNMAPTMEKTRRGIEWRGMSPLSDMKSGGANYVFTRLKRTYSAYDEPGLVWKAKAIKRLDSISYKTDHYGNTRGSFVLDNRASTISEWRKAAEISNNETIFKNSLSIFDDLDAIVVSNPSEKEAVIVMLNKHGYTSWPDGRTLEDVVRIAGR
jgi:hypothetical protein